MAKTKEHSLFKFFYSPKYVTMTVSLSGVGKSGLEPAGLKPDPDIRKIGKKWGDPAAWNRYYTHLTCTELIQSFILLACDVYLSSNNF